MKQSLLTAVTDGDADAGTINPLQRKLKLLKVGDCSTRTRLARQALAEGAQRANPSFVEAIDHGAFSPAQVSNSSDPCAGYWNFNAQLACAELEPVRGILRNHMAFMVPAHLHPCLLQYHTPINLPTGAIYVKLITRALFQQNFSSADLFDDEERGP